MQVKLLIATAAFMLTMIIFGYAALREPARMETTTAAFEARTVEKGAAIFFNNCATCHGIDGKAEECYDAAGERIGCRGLPLNHAPLLCGVPSERMKALNWNGSKESFINATVTVGRSLNGMPTWGAAYGGPMEPYQVDQVVQFVLNWETEELCQQPTREPTVWPDTVSELPAGDATNGEQLFLVTYGCSACHGNPAEPGSNAVGPWLGDIENVGATRVDGYTAASYVYESILLPSAHIAPDCPTGPCAGPPSGMPANFGERMSEQDMADVLAYLLGTSSFEGDSVIPYGQ